MIRDNPEEPVQIGPVKLVGYQDATMRDAEALREMAAEVERADDHPSADGFAEALRRAAAAIESAALTGRKLNGETDGE